MLCEEMQQRQSGGEPQGHLLQNGEGRRVLSKCGVNLCDSSRSLERSQTIIGHILRGSVSEPMSCGGSCLKPTQGSEDWRFVPCPSNCIGLR